MPFACADHDLLIVVTRQRKGHVWEFFLSSVLDHFTDRKFSYTILSLFAQQVERTVKPGRKGGRVVECTALERRRVQ